jgi:uncharacterized glyoxalase superfamily protein PhnB
MTDPHSIMAFVPAKDFSISSEYYKALGFEVAMDDDVRFVSLGDYGFLLQDFYVKDWADNFMMAMHVDDAQAWIDRAEALVERFPGTRTIAPELQDWGMLVAHIFDPTGVLWHITQVPDPDIEDDD